MANTFVLISTVTVGSGGTASIAFTSIPATYTDLIIKLTTRYNVGGFDGQYIAFNSSSLTFSGKYALGNGATTQTGSLAQYIGTVNDSTSTANTFTSTEIYIPNYAGSTNKSFSVNNATENNATTSYINIVGGLWATSSAITSISMTPTSGLFVEYSSASLYGISST